MGEAFNDRGQKIAEAFGASKREVFDKLQNLAPEASEIRIRSLKERLDEEQRRLGGVSTQMPKYRCHKEVWALKIADVILDSDIAQREGRETDGSALITPADAGYAPFAVDHDYVRKHSPKAGGYYVVYKDGYKSFSPADAFEEGYTRL